ncbi:MAG: flagellar basal body-associated FliL family protein [Marinobacter sp.]|uniref:flagellar basal body-associated FliL family protein n=1 Tax=Marinobacter sp. TaxID=50741 RepID=UPI00299E4047|nr:flagellar basal body-associated FliL family protein [Marinobacter sp.]MDX1633222.1 flagellar basal body-associated FliL family protein [Marinobacter sp.]
MISMRHPLLSLIIALLLALPVTALQAAEDEAPAEETEEQAEEVPKETIYVAMEPAFVTHVGDASGNLTYLKAEVTLRASTAAAEAAAEAHMPRLRHEVLMLLNGQDDLDRLTSPEGKQALREQAKERVNAVLAEQQTGAQIDDVLFTSFVVQR